VTVKYLTTTGTASSILTSEYGPHDAHLRTGRDEQAVIIPVTRDTYHELDETLLLNLSQPTNGPP
jgi:hypothetical protein